MLSKNQRFSKFSIIQLIKYSLNEVKTTVLWNEGSDFLGVFDQLDTDAFANSRVRLFCFNAAENGKELKMPQIVDDKERIKYSKKNSQLFNNDALGHASSSEWVGLPLGSQVALLVALIIPALLLTVLLQLTCCADTLWLAHCSVQLSSSY